MFLAIIAVTPPEGLSALTHAGVEEIYVTPREGGGNVRAGVVYGALDERGAFVTYPMRMFSHIDIPYEGEGLPDLPALFGGEAPATAARERLVPTSKAVVADAEAEDAL